MRGSLYLLVNAPENKPALLIIDYGATAAN